MKYDDCQRLFARRASGRNFKSVFASAMQMKMRPSDGAFVFERKMREYTRNQVTKGYDRRDYTVEFATLTPGNLLTLECDVKNSDNQAKNLWRKIAGFGYAYSDTNRFGGYDHSSRFHVIAGEPTVPFAKGLVLNLATRTVVAHVPDVKRTVNRGKSKDIYEYARKVIRAMRVMARVGAFTFPVNGNFRYNHECATALLRTQDLAMTDENIAAFAEAAYLTAKATSVGPWNGRVVKQEEGYEKWVAYTAEESKVLHDKAVINLAARKLRETLQKTRDVFDIEVISTTTKGVI